MIKKQQLDKQINKKDYFNGSGTMSLDSFKMLCKGLAISLAGKDIDGTTTGQGYSHLNFNKKWTETKIETKPQEIVENEPPTDEININVQVPESKEAMEANQVGGNLSNHSGSV